MKHKVLGLHVRNLTFYALESGISLFINLRIYRVNVFGCVPIQRVATGTTNMATPVESIDKKRVFLKFSGCRFKAYWCYLQLLS